MKNSSINTKELLRLYLSMRRIRFFEEKIIELYPQQEMRTPVHLCIGQEAIAAGVCYHLNKEDTIFSTHRNHGHCLAKGMTFYQLIAEFYGKKTGTAGGKGGSMHPVDPERGIYGTTAIVGGNIPIAVGAAWTHKYNNSGKLSVALFGDGATEEGTFHESLNFASLKKLPVLFICENNFYATASHISQRQPVEPSISCRASAYGIQAEQIDGNDIAAVCSTVSRATEHIRNNNGPYFIEAITYRWKSHVGPADDTRSGHRPDCELELWQKKCPVSSSFQMLIKKGLWSTKEEDSFLQQLENEFSQAQEKAIRDPFPDETDCFQNVFQE